jgi:hypothetical protein
VLCIIIQASEILEGEVDEDPTYPWHIQLGRYLRRTVVILDLLSVLPLTICLLVYSVKDEARPDYLWFNIARILQLVKLLQFQKNRRSAAVITQTVILTYKTFLFMFWCILLVVLFIGAIVFALERGDFTVNEDYPEGAFLRPNVRHDGKEVSPFTSLGVTLYWVVVSVTTVGYGDIVPTSHASRAICSILFLFSILILSLPVSVIGESFGKAMEQYNNEKKKRDTTSKAIKQFVEASVSGSPRGFIGNPMSLSRGSSPALQPRDTSMSSIGMGDYSANTMSSLFGYVGESGMVNGDKQLEESVVSRRKPFEFEAAGQQSGEEKDGRRNTTGTDKADESGREREIQILESSLDINEVLSCLRSHWEVCNRCQSQLTISARKGSEEDDEVRVLYEKYQRSRAAMTAAQERLQNMLQNHDVMMLKIKQVAVQK